MDNTVETNVEINNTEAQPVENEEVKAATENQAEAEASISENKVEKPKRKIRERFFGMSKVVTSFFLQLVSIFITFCAATLTLLSCGVAGFGIIAELIPEISAMDATAPIYTFLFFFVVICAVVLMMVAIVPASLSLVSSIAAIKAFINKAKQHKPVPFVTLFFGIISFIVGALNVVAIFSVAMMLFPAFATFSVPMFL